MMLHDGPDLLAPRSFFSVSGSVCFGLGGRFLFDLGGRFLFGLGGRFCSVSGVVFFQSRGSVFFGLGVRFFLTWNLGLGAENGVRKCDICWACLFSPRKIV